MSLNTCLVFEMWAADWTTIVWPVPFLFLLLAFRDCKCCKFIATFSHLRCQIKYSMSIFWWGYHRCSHGSLMWEFHQIYLELVTCWSVIVIITIGTTFCRDLSYNKLSGDVPTSGSFSHFNSTRYINALVISAYCDASCFWRFLNVGIVVATLEWLLLGGQENRLLSSHLLTRWHLMMMLLLYGSISYLIEVAGHVPWWYQSSWLWEKFYIWNRVFVEVLKLYYSCWCDLYLSILGTLKSITDRYDCKALCSCLIRRVLLSYAVFWETPICVDQWLVNRVLDGFHSHLLHAHHHLDEGLWSALAA
jgi:hypothetical protein